MCCTSSHYHIHMTLYAYNYKSKVIMVHLSRKLYRRQHKQWWRRYYNYSINYIMTVQDLVNIAQAIYYIGVRTFIRILYSWGQLNNVYILAEVWLTLGYNCFIPSGFYLGCNFGGKMCMGKTWKLGWSGGMTPQKNLDYRPIWDQFWCHQHCTARMSMRVIFAFSLLHNYLYTTASRISSLR